MEFTLLYAAGTAFAAVWGTNRLLRRRFPPWLDRPTDLIIGSAAVGMLIGRLASMIDNGVNPLTSPGDILLVRGGVSPTFATLGALASVAWALRDHLPTALDLLAPAGVAGLAGWHAGCLWRGTCLGTASDLPWAMSLEGSAIGRHPVELYAAFGLTLVAVGVGKLRRPALLPFGTAIAGAALVRLATQPFRLSVLGGPVELYVAGVVVGVIAVAVALGSRRRTDVTV